MNLKALPMTVKALPFRDLEISAFLKAEKVLYVSKISHEKEHFYDANQRKQCLPGLINTTFEHNVPKHKTVVLNFSSRSDNVSFLSYEDRSPYRSRLSSPLCRNCVE